MLTVMRPTASDKLRTQTKSSLSSLRRHHNQESESRETERARLIEALSDLHDLLEQYAPSWYTEEHHLKAESALQSAKGY